MSQNPMNIITAKPVGDYCLHLTFDDGKEQTVDFKPFLTCAQLKFMSAYLHLPVVPAGIAGTQGTGTHMASCVLDAVPAGVGWALPTLSRLQVAETMIKVE